MLFTPEKFRISAPLLGMLAAMLLSACGTPLDREAMRHVHTIALIPADDPAVGVNPVDNIAGMPGYMGGAIGAILAPGGGAEQSKALNEQMKQRNVLIGTEVTAQVEDALGESGFKIIRLGTVIHKRRGNLLENYDGFNTSADAILDINVPVAGFYDKPFSPYYPTLALDARLVDIKSKRELFYQRFSYGGTTSLYPDRVVEADSRYSFWKRDDIAKSPEVAAEGMRVGVAALVKLLTKKLADNGQGDP